MNTMSPSRRARLPQAFTPVLLRLVTLALLVGVFGALAVHHSDSATADAPTVATAMVATAGTLPDPVGAEAATITSDPSWLVAAGCAALALCCVLGLAIAKRVAQRDRPPLTSAAPAPRSVSPLTPAIAAPMARPSLLDLSISRT
jgi:hypothetical protein